MVRAEELRDYERRSSVTMVRAQEQRGQSGGAACSSCTT